MGNWLDVLQMFASEAARQVGLPPKMVQAFDGDGWVWSWRERLERLGEPSARLREATLTSRTDAAREVVTCQVLGRAWLEGARDAVWSQTYFADNRPVREIEEHPSSHPWSKHIVDALRRAWVDAGSAAEGLPELRQRRRRAVDEALDKLRESSQGSDI